MMDGYMDVYDVFKKLESGDLLTLLARSETLREIIKDVLTHRHNSFESHARALENQIECLKCIIASKEGVAAEANPDPVPETPKPAKKKRVRRKRHTKKTAETANQKKRSWSPAQRIAHGVRMKNYWAKRKGEK